MGQVSKNWVEPLQAAAFGLPVSKPRAEDSRTVLKQYLLDTVLPAFALLMMSALTVTMIVLIVTTVAHGGWLTPGTYVNVDPWASTEPGPATLREDDIMYPEVATRPGAERQAPSFEPQARSESGTGYFAGMGE